MTATAPVPFLAFISSIILAMCLCSYATCFLPFLSSFISRGFCQSHPFKEGSSHFSSSVTSTHLSTPASSRRTPPPFVIDFDKKNPYTTLHFCGYQYHTTTKPLFAHEGSRKFLTMEQPKKDRSNSLNRFMNCDKDVYSGSPAGLLITWLIYAR